MIPTMIPQIYFYDKSQKYYKITYYEKNYMQTAYYSYETLIASTHAETYGNTYMRLHLDPDSSLYSNTTARHIKEMLGFDKKQYRKEWEISQKRQKKLETTPNWDVDTYHEALYVLSDLLIPFGSMDVMSLAKEFRWATQTLFHENELVEQIESTLEEIGAEPGDINNYIWALYNSIENEVWNRIENMLPEEIVELLRDNGWKKMAEHAEYLIHIGDFDSDREDMIERRRNVIAYNINCCASSFDWEPLDQSMCSDGTDATLARCFEGAYRQYIDENYDGVCDADKDDTEESGTTES